MTPVSTEGSLTPLSPLRSRRGETAQPRGEAIPPSDTAQPRRESSGYSEAAKPRGAASSLPTNRITAHVRELRQQQTPAEEQLWQALRNSKTGFKFVRQKPFIVGYFGKRHTFIVDFYSKECRLVVEADGRIHEKHRGYDNLRTQLLEQQYSLRVRRFTNADIFNNISYVVDTIKQCCALKVLPPLSARGEGLGVRP